VARRAIPGPHLAAAIGAPWLPQTFLSPVLDLGADPDDARRGFAAGASRHRRASHAGPEPGPADAPHHELLRLKHRRLPPPYRDALARWLPRGATLYVVNCTKRWPVTRTGERSVFQFGAVGGATQQECFQGGERVRAYFRRYHAHRARWDPPEPDGEAPEAEWGFDPALRADLDAMAHERGWRVVELRFEEPETLSPVAAALHGEWYRDLGDASGPRRLLADSFVIMAPLRTQRLRAIAFWLLFGVEPSADHLARFLGEQPKFDEVDLFLFSHGTDGVGLAPIEAWQHLARRGRWPGRLLGVDPRRFPSDFATFARFHRALETLAPVQEAPPPLALGRFETLLRQHAVAASGVEMVERPAPTLAV